MLRLFYKKQEKYASLVLASVLMCLQKRSLSGKARKFLDEKIFEEAKASKASFFSYFAFGDNELYYLMSLVESIELLYPLTKEDQYSLSDFADFNREAFYGVFEGIIRKLESRFDEIRNEENGFEMPALQFSKKLLDTMFEKDAIIDDMYEQFERLDFPLTPKNHNTVLYELCRMATFGSPCTEEQKQFIDMYAEKVYVDPEKVEKLLNQAIRANKLYHSNLKFIFYTFDFISKSFIKCISWVYCKIRDKIRS